ncbi:MAG: hypothetical protein DME10_12170 [Candidatus Rokuibacteriota bacterium]|nr:MAG: hypothetical protein DME10_12170 [Candidatus Rokubacteria bacterium]
MANQHSVARRDGVFKTNNVVVEAGWLVASDYEFTLNAHQQIGATGLLKVFQLAPSDPASSSLRFVGRWDEADNVLDIDARA